MVVAFPRSSVLLCALLVAPIATAGGQSAQVASAQWDTASWDTAGWETASWDTAAWDTAGWDTASWDTAAWDTAAWDTAAWDSMSFQGLPAPWGLAAIGAPAAWAKGTPTHDRLVCIVDTGIDVTHPALRANLWTGPRGEHGWNAIDGSTDVRDEVGHGTLLAGIIAASRDSPWPGVGSPLVAVAKAIGPDGLGRTADVSAGIRWCSHIGSNVILLALSEDAPTKDFREAVRSAQEHGALVVAAAGNTGPCKDCVSAPASFPRVLAVGAAGPDGQATTFTSTGKGLDLLAPGERITSTVPGGYRAASGTSEAAAFAAGAAAFVWGSCTSWDADHVANVLTRGGSRGHQPPLLTLDLGKHVECEGE